MAGDSWRVGVLLGGTSAEHDVSVNSGLNVLDGLRERGHDGRPIYLAPDGRWHFGVRPTPPSLERERGASASGPGGALASSTTAERCVLERLAAEGYDAVFVALHGPGGEDGTVQGLLRHAGVPFTGSDVLASALAMDKARAKRLLASVGVPVPDSATLPRATSADRVRAATDRVGLPCVVKPVAGGSSFGTRIVRREDEVGPAFGEAARLDARVLIEAFIAGREATCGVLGGGPHEEPTALPVTEIVPTGDEFFDFRAKYTVGACEEITPGRFPESTAAEIRRLATLAHETLGCEGMSRSDFIVGDDGPVFLETNTVPGMTRTSLLPQGAAAAGLGFGELVERLVGSALRRAAGEAPSGD